MTIEADLKICEETVRRADPDRYLSALFAPSERRELLFALYAFNHEIARIAETVREPMIGDIRLEWWREAVVEARDGRPRAHIVARALAELFARSGPPLELFETMIEARQFDVSAEMFPDMRALVSYADATSGVLMRIALQILCDGAGPGDVAHEAGVAYGLTGILRALPHHTARRKLYLPADVLKAEGIDADSVWSGKADHSALHAVIARIAAVARAHYESAHAQRVSAQALPALLPAALVPLYLKRVLRARDPLHDVIDMPAYRKQIAFVRRAWRG
jgi:phytoene/squalene synthetase